MGLNRWTKENKASGASLEEKTIGNMKASIFYAGPGQYVYNVSEKYGGELDFHKRATCKSARIAKSSADRVMKQRMARHSELRNWSGEPAKTCGQCGSKNTSYLDKDTRTCNQCGTQYALQ